MKLSVALVLATSSALAAALDLTARLNNEHFIADLNSRNMTWCVAQTGASC